MSKLQRFLDRRQTELKRENRSSINEALWNDDPVCGGCRGRGQIDSPNAGGRFGGGLISCPTCCGRGRIRT